MSSGEHEYERRECVMMYPGGCVCDDASSREAASEGLLVN